MFLYQFKCEKCEKIHDVYRHHSQSGEPYKCGSCGANADRLYTSAEVKEFPSYYTLKGERIGTYKQEARHLKKNGRILTQDHPGWKDIKRMAKDGQRRTQLQQKGHY